MAMDATHQTPLAAAAVNDPSNGEIRDTLRSLIQVNQDAAKGFDEAAERLENPEHVATFRRLGAERARFAGELTEVGSRFLDEMPEDSMASKLHRVWINVKDAFTAGDHAILAAAESGEDHAKETYEDALDDALPDGVRKVVLSQYEAIRTAHDTVKAMRDSTG